MPRIHHVNLGVPPGLEDAEEHFLEEVLGYVRATKDERMDGFGARWFDAEDGTQIHLSTDEDHRPASKAHTAIEVGEQRPVIEAKLEATGIGFRTASLGEVQLLMVEDPAGNRWELRS
jgi:catechol 2,3-dioxygenase-like lactoylglutathione lyase family enzyme